MTIGRLDVFFSGFVNVGKDVAPDVDALLHVLNRFVKVFSCFLRLQRVGTTNVHSGWGLQTFTSGGDCKRSQRVGTTNVHNVW